MHFSPILLSMAPLLALVSSSPAASNGMRQLKDALNVANVTDPNIHEAVDNVIVQLDAARPETTPSSDDDTDVISTTNTSKAIIPKGNQMGRVRSRPMDFSRLAQAMKRLADTCSKQGMPPRSTLVDHDDDFHHIAYVCNYGGNNRCDLSEMLATLGELWKHCGKPVAGWFFITAWNKTYGFDWYDRAFCTNI